DCCVPSAATFCADTRPDSLFRDGTVWRFAMAPRVLKTNTIIRIRGSNRVRTDVRATEAHDPLSGVLFVETVTPFPAEPLEMLHPVEAPVEAPAEAEATAEAQFVVVEEPVALEPPVEELPEAAFIADETAAPVAEQDETIPASEFLVDEDEVAAALLSEEPADVAEEPVESAA